MKPTRKLTPNQKFFFDNAAFSWDPKIESQALGRTRCAVESANAETLYLQAHRVADVRIVWEHDAYAASDAHIDGFDFDTCESCALIGPDDQFLASLGAVLDADDKYRRVIRADLASKCATELRDIVRDAT